MKVLANIRFLKVLFMLVILISCSKNDNSIPESTVIVPTDETPSLTIGDAKIEIVMTGYQIPWAIEVLSENNYLVSERLGTLYHYENGTVSTVIGIPATATTEFSGLTYGGLMDVSLHPQFNSNKLVYIAYVASDYKLNVAKFELDGNSAKNLRIIFKSNAFSIGSRIAWQDDSHFFLTQGLGGSPFPEPGPQNLSNDGGKIHRLTADGKVPSDNPIFSGDIAPTTVYTYGHRDPQGLFYNKEKQILYSNEHGPLGGDELNIIEEGENYGWPLFSYGLNYDGSAVSNMTEQEAALNTKLPIKHWGTNLRVAPSSLLELENSNFSSWNGLFVMGALGLKSLISFNQATGETKVLLENVGRVRDVAQLPSGDLLLLIDAHSPSFSDSGRIIKISPK